MSVAKPIEPCYESTPAAAREAGAAGDDAELVLLIHGTFAGDDDDIGHRWWQQGSPAWNQLQRQLPAGTRLPELGEVFHWSGQNSERARIKAGQDLLERLEELEAAGRSYHVIGHSHGGSVIWHALRLATLRRRTLNHLRSWSTVGTPFLHYKTRGALSPANIINVVLAFLLIKPAYEVFIRFFKLAFAAALGTNETIDLRSDHEVGMLMAMVRFPLLKLVEFVGVPVVHNGEAIRVGSYDPSAGGSLREYLFCSWEGWVITSVIVLGVYFFLMLASLFLNPVLESLRIRAEKKLETNAMLTYRGRWLGLWSTSDEAINGLRATLDLSVSFVNQITPRERILFSDYLAIIAQPYLWMLTPAFNHVLRPWLDQFVRSFVVKAAQGNNRPAAEVVAVSPFPVPTRASYLHPSLPDSINQELVRRADNHARDIAPKLRELLAHPSFVAGLERFGHTLTGHELIHTSYFDHGAVLKLLAMHISWAQRRGQPLRLADRKLEPLGVWLREFKRTVHEGVELAFDHETPRILPINSRIAPHAADDTQASQRQQDESVAELPQETRRLVYHSAAEVSLAVREEPEAREEPTLVKPRRRAATPALLRRSA